MMPYQYIESPLLEGFKNILVFAYFINNNNFKSIFILFFLPFGLYQKKSAYSGTLQNYYLDYSPSKFTSTLYAFGHSRFTA